MYGYLNIGICGGTKTEAYMASASAGYKCLADMHCTMTNVLTKNMDLTLLFHAYNFDDSKNNNIVGGAGGGYNILHQDGNHNANYGGGASIKFC